MSRPHLLAVVANGAVRLGDGLAKDREAGPRISLATSGDRRCDNSVEPTTSVNSTATFLMVKKHPPAWRTPE